MKLHDESIEQVIALAEDAIMEGDCQNGKRMLENVLYDEPGYAKVHATLAWMYRFYQTDEKQAIRFYELALFFEPDNSDHFENLADFYLDKRMFERLERLLLRGLNQDEMAKEFIFENLGRIREKEGRFAEAISFYRKALVHCMDNDEMQELKQTIKRTKFKRFKNRIKKWQLQN